MTAGVIWSMVAALGFGFTQTLNRKSNLLIGASRTAFGLLVVVEVILIVRAVLTGEISLIASAPTSSIAYFTGSASIHYVLGWTLLARSQHQIGVAATGAVVSATPLVGTILAAIFLDEPLTGFILVGVITTVLGVALLSLNRGNGIADIKWTIPTYGLAVAACWGTSPMLIRKGLEGLDSPVLGLTAGLGIALAIHAVVLTASGAWEWKSWTRRSLPWLGLGGATGAVGISAQWISFGLTTIAVAITVQQLAVLVVIALAPIMFKSPLERLTPLLLTGTGAVIAGSVMVVLSLS